MSPKLARHLLILATGFLLILLGVLFQLRQNSSVSTPSSEISKGQDISQVIFNSLQQQRRYFQRCWLKASPTAQPTSPDEPAAPLTWQIFLRIEPTGRVKEFSLLNKSLFDAETEKCLREISYRMKFPSFEGEDVSVTVPIVISSFSENR